MTSPYYQERPKSEMITLQKTIEILELNIKEAGKSMPTDTLAALKQSTECTRYCLVLKANPHLIDTIPIPGILGTE